MKLTLNKIVGLSITLLIGIMTIVSLVFPLLTMEKANSTISENGFDFLRFTSDIIGKDYAWAEIVVGLLCVFCLIIGVGSILVAILMFFTSESNKKLLFISNLLCLSISILYLLAGVISVGVSNANFTGTFSTLAYIPAIISCLFYLSYLFCLYKIPNTEICKNSSKNTQKKVFDELIKLKQLLDMGAITQEEFDAKKKELLSL